MEKAFRFIGGTPFFCCKWFDTSATELYNLSEDLGETKDLSKTNPAQLARLRKRLAAWRTLMGVDVPFRSN
jgi:hypothetical protein